MKVECFCNHFSLAMFSGQKGSRYENKENRQKQKTIKKTKPKFVSVFFFFTF